MAAGFLSKDSWNKDLNNDRYISKGTVQLDDTEEYSSYNPRQLNAERMKELLMKLDGFKELAGEEKMKVLIIAPHPDDEVLGCGGIIARNVNEGNEVYVAVVTKMCEPVFREELDVQNKEHCLNAHGVLGVKDTVFLDFPAAMLESVPRHILNSRIGKIITDIAPEEVYIPHRGDMHLDHKMVVDSCMVAMRPRFDYSVKRIFAYETLSETEWDIPNTTNVFIPNVYVDITDYLEIKTRAMQEYKNQICEFPNPRSIEGIKALAMLRGSTIGKQYAEAFSLIREIK